MCAGHKQIFKYLKNIAESEKYFCRCCNYFILVKAVSCHHLRSSCSKYSMSSSLLPPLKFCCLQLVGYFEADSLSLLIMFPLSTKSGGVKLFIFFQPGPYSFWEFFEGKNTFNDHVVEKSDSPFDLLTQPIFDDFGLFYVFQIGCLNRRKENLVGYFVVFLILKQTHIGVIATLFHENGEFLKLNWWLHRAKMTIFEKVKDTWFHISPSPPPPSNCTITLLANLTA